MNFSILYAQHLTRELEKNDTLKSMTRLRMPIPGYSNDLFLAPIVRLLNKATCEAFSTNNLSRSISFLAPPPP